MSCPPIGSSWGRTGLCRQCNPVSRSAVNAVKGINPLIILLLYSFQNSHVVYFIIVQMSANFRLHGAEARADSPMEILR